MHHPTDRITHTTAFVTPVVEHWLEREIAQWVHPMKNRSDDPPHHDRTSYFEKVFDSLSWTFIEKALDLFNFKISIKNWIRTLYYNSTSRVHQNRFLSESFKLERGCRQGYPLSPYIFIICAEILAILIRN